jgi:glycosyltransferase involved in cell wall biosynthesis
MLKDMKLAVFSHKPCWYSFNSPSGFATDGGFPFQMRALAEIFGETRVVAPVAASGPNGGEIALEGVKVVPLSQPAGRGIWRKLSIVPWLLRNGGTMFREILRADAVHTPIPGDIGTIGMVLAILLRKRLYVRHCGNWANRRTTAEKLWRWVMEEFAGGRNVMVATGGHSDPPSSKNKNIAWLFSTSLTERELKCQAPGTTPKRLSSRLIIVSRQEHAKGTGVVIASLPLLAGRFPEMRLDVVGDGAALQEFKSLAAELGVLERVVFHGKVGHDRVLELLRDAALFCFPTTSSEGFPKVVLEGLACALPVITTRVSVLPQLIGSRCGVLLDEATPDAVASAVTYCLSNERRYRTMSLNAVETASSYSLERWRDTIARMLSSAWRTEWRSSQTCQS